MPYLAREAHPAGRGSCGCARRGLWVDRPDLAAGHGPGACRGAHRATLADAVDHAVLYADAVDHAVALSDAVADPG